VNPCEFFRIAQLLINSDEASIRTSVGRSYYGAFLYFREYLGKLGLQKQKNPRNQAHEFLIQCLQFCNVAEGRNVSIRLADLQQKREDADYKLNEQISKQDAEDALADARSLIKYYSENIPADKEKLLIQNAVAYAQRKCWM
jgi:uncharacterized protein (UPF0332 family)